MGFNSAFKGLKWR